MIHISERNPAKIDVEQQQSCVPAKLQSSKHTYLPKLTPI